MNDSSRLHNWPSHLVSAAVALALASALSTVSFAAQEEADDLGEVVVTGSRIVRRDYSSQSPLVTVASETFEERSNIGIESALNQLPQFAPGGTQSMLSAASTPFPNALAAPGAATVNLRGLGTGRSLVLVNGRRVQPVNGSLVVDLNTIPSSAIQKVEVITGGAAAVYGADAISGVVNLILKRDFEGAEFGAQYGISEKGDGQEVQVSGLLGSNFSDGRGNVMLGVNYADRGNIFGKDRAYINRGWNDPGTTAGNINSSNLSQFNPGTTNLPTLYAAPAGSNYGIDPNGKIFFPNQPLNAAHPFTGTLGGAGGLKISPDGTLGFDDKVHNYLQLPLERYAIFGSSDFKLTDSLTWFTEVHFAESKTEAKGFVSQLFNVWSPTVPYNRLYDDPASPTFGQAPAGVAEHAVPAELAALLNSRPNPNAPWTYQGGMDYFPNYSTVTTSNVFQVVSGLRGSVGENISWMKDWTWEVYGSHGKSTVNAQQPDGFPFLPRIQELFNATHYGRGFRVAYPVGVAGSCTSGLPIFTDSGQVDNTPSTTLDCADYAVLRMNNVTTLTQEVAEATVQGTLFKLPAGPLQFAAGANYRSENFRFDPDSGFNANQSFPNVIQNIALPVSVNGLSYVKELYAEFAIPVLSGIPGIKRLEIDPGVRFSDYKTAGQETTFKVMADWEIIDSIRLRGGFQRANRAPNVTELFTPRGGSNLDFGAVDACTNFPGITPVWGNVTGNPNLQNLQTLCQELMVRDGAPASIYVPGQASANNYKYNVFGGTFFFPISLGISEGNLNLASEKADTITAGVVFKSPFEVAALQRLTLSIDYFKIDITGAIGVPGHNTVYQQCMDPTFNPLLASTAGSLSGAALAAGNAYCGLIQREYIGDGLNDYGADRKFKAAYINQGGILAEGVDLQIDWATQLADLGMASVPGMITANFQFSHLSKYAVSAFPGSPPVDYTGTIVNSSFDYRMFTTLGYTNGAVSGGLRWQHLPKLDPDPTGQANATGVNSHDQFDVFGRWAINKRYELRAGIDNVLNAQPEIVGATVAVGATAGNNNLGGTGLNYDTIGRRFFLAVQVSL
jgi:iron complex outermembrane recepter protein